MKTKFAIVVVLLCIGIVSLAQKPVVIEEIGWRKIGNISASFQKESGVIIVLYNDEFASIKLRAKDAPITIGNVQIFFEGGKVQQADVNQALNAGQDTDLINLYAENKRLDKVIFAYTKHEAEQSETAIVELYGNKEFIEAGPPQVTKLEHDSIDQKGPVADSVVKNQEVESATYEKIESKTGPNGETIYIDNNKNYYWVNEKGEKRFISVLDLRDK